MGCVVQLAQVSVECDQVFLPVDAVQTRETATRWWSSL
jgi:hypothetical protein